MFRYVILRHETPPDFPRGPHWDFMIEAGDVLFCWELTGELDGESEVRAQRLPDHRKLYLDYEGPLSEGRGSVRRWDAGVYQPHCTGTDGLRLALQGQRLAGTVDIEQEPGDDQRWTFRFTPA